MTAVTYYKVVYIRHMQDHGLSICRLYQVARQGPGGVRMAQGVRV